MKTVLFARTLTWEGCLQTPESFAQESGDDRLRGTISWVTRVQRVVIAQLASPRLIWSFVAAGTPGSSFCGDARAGNSVDALTNFYANATVNNATARAGGVEVSSRLCCVDSHRPPPDQARSLGPGGTCGEERARSSDQTRHRTVRSTCPAYPTARDHARLECAG